MLGQTLVSLLPVIIGGLIALLGGAVGPVVSHFLTSKNDRKRERIEKFEELFELLGDYERWVESEYKRMVWGEKTVSRPSPLLRAQAICAMYFHDLKPYLVELNEATANYFLWMSDAGIRRVQKTPNISEGFKDVYAPYHRKWVECVKATSDYATTKGNGI